MSIPWYFTRVEVIQTFINISENLHGSMLNCAEMNYTTHRTKVAIRMLLQSVYSYTTINLRCS